MTVRLIAFPNSGVAAASGNLVKVSPFASTLLVALVTAVPLWHFGWLPAPEPGDRAALFGTLAQVAGTMLGFMLAALAVVASINHTHLVKMMRRTGHYISLLQTLFAGAAVFFACVVLSMVSLLGLQLGPRGMALLMGLHISAVFSLCVTGWQFWLVLSNLHSDTE